MPVIFLDIDGVLNTRGDMSVKIDKCHLVHLKTIVDATGAAIVLSTSWRKFWRKSGSIDSAGQAIDEALAEIGLSVWDKIPVIPNASRSQEIEAWLLGKYIEGFAILDDVDMGWSDKLYSHWIKCGGLTEDLAKQAIEVLNGNLLPPREAFPIEQKKHRSLLDRFLNRK